MVLVDGTVPSTNSFLDRTGPSTNSLLDRTLKKLKFQKISSTHSEPPLVWPQKCQSSVQRLKGTLFPEGNQLFVYWELSLNAWELI